MPRLLVVEDSAATRALVKGILSAADLKEEGEASAFTVDEASSGFEAMRLLPRTAYALVITDINMPDIHGLELIQFMRKSAAHSATPILIISTQASTRDVERALGLGANRFLKKPFSPIDLLSAVKDLLGAALV
jgi:two-component system, chemotaxis family, chemotaxis protein CheY